LVENINTIQKIREALLFSCKVVGIDVNTEIS